MTRPPDPRSDDAQWDVCSECEREGVGWGAVVYDGRCAVHLSNVELAAYVERVTRDVPLPLHFTFFFDARGCTITAEALQLVVASYGDKGPEGTDQIRLGAINFTGATFTTDVSLDGAVFENLQTFKDSTFLSESRFESAKFRGGADFDDATFHGRADFHGAQFDSWARFRNATFGDVSWFEEATFTSETDFGRATFDKYAYFVRTQFSAIAKFDDAEFDFVVFEGATFGKDARFDGTKFDAVDFDGATFSRDARFDSARFASIAKFDSVTMDRTCSFEGARFETRMPSFSGTRFSAAVVLDPYSALASYRRGSFRLHATAASVRNLRAAVEAARNEQGANVLYEIEMKCRANEMGRSHWPERSILAFYRLTSGYGIRPLRALLCWFTVVALAAVSLHSVGYKTIARTTSSTPVVATSVPAHATARQKGSARPQNEELMLVAVRASSPGWKVNEDAMTPHGRWIVTASRILGTIVLGLFALSVRAQVKRGG